MLRKAAVFSRFKKKNRRERQKEELFAGDTEKRDEEFFMSFKAGKNVRLIRSVCDANVRVYM